MSTLNALATGQLAERIRQATEDYCWLEDLGFYAQGMSLPPIAC